MSPPAPIPQARASKQAEDADQAIVFTPYGRGMVVRTREGDGIKEVQLLEWEGFAKPNGSKSKPFMMYTPVDYPSVVPHVGDDVVCQYGRGRVAHMARVSGANKESTLKYSIALSSWRLNGRSTVTCHVTSPPPRVVRKHTLGEMDAHEKVEMAKGQKLKATKYFSEKKDYNLALTTYAGAVDAVRNVQHDYTSSNEVRADLVVVMVTSSNNAATCCLKLKKFEEASKFAKNALILLDALYGKRGKKIHTILNKEGTIDAKLFGEWRVKSYLVVARSCIERGKIPDAVEILKKARGVAMGYVEELKSKGESREKKENASFKALTSQVKEIRRIMAECSEKKKATKKMEKRRAKAMFAGDKENTPPGNEKGRKQEKVEVQTKPLDENKGKGIEAGVDSGIKAVNVHQGDEMPYQRKSSLNAAKDGSCERPSVAKSVSFSNRPPEVKKIESTIDDDDEDPWYSEHKEALIMLAIAGFSATALMALRRSFR
ncbi:hypothetical protein ACHAWF_013553 [Thalassiosira exigua]